jgi:hypothetical protein
MKGKYIWGVLIIVAVTLFYFSRASTFVTDIKFNEDSKVTVEQTSDKMLPRQLPEVLQDRLAYQHYSKLDFIFVIFYNFSLQIDPTLSGLSDGNVPKIKLSTKLPGKVTSTNATEIQDNEVIWTKIPNEPMSAYSYAIRWWLLGLVGLINLVLGYNFYQRRKNN